MRNATLLFLTKHSSGKISEVCLAMKKRGFGVGRWNGVGGKVTEGETIEDATRRETKEEIGVTVGKLSKVAELAFKFAYNPAWDQLVHVYFCNDWQGEPSESEEMAPKWFSVDNLPFSDMWPDDPLWLPRVLAGEKLSAAITFGEGDKILDSRVIEAWYGES